MLAFLFSSDSFPSVLRWKIHTLPSLKAIVPREKILHKSIYKKKRVGKVKVCNTVIRAQRALKLKMSLAHHLTDGQSFM